MQAAFAVDLQVHLERVYRADNAVHVASGPVVNHDAVPLVEGLVVDEQRTARSKDCSGGEKVMHISVQTRTATRFASHHAQRAVCKYRHLSHRSPLCTCAGFG